MAGIMMNVLNNVPYAGGGGGIIIPGITLLLDPNAYPGSGNIWPDSGPNGYDATLYGLGNAQWSFQYGYFWTFPMAASGNYAYIPNEIALSQSTFTISIWFKMGNFGGGTLISKLRYDNSTVNYYFSCNAGIMEAYVKNNSGRTDIQGGDIGVYNNNVWYFATLTRELGSPSTMKIYINDALIATQSDSLFNVSNDQPILIGSSLLTPEPYQFVGSLGHVLIYGNQAMTLSQIQQNYLATRPNYYNTPP